MSFLSKWFGNKKSSAGMAPDTRSVGPLPADQKATLEKLIDDLGNEYDIEGRIKAAGELGTTKEFGDIDVAAVLAAAGIKAAMQFESKRMGIAMMHGVRPDQIDVKPHVDDSRVTSAVASALRKLASRRDDAGQKSKAALADLKSSIKNAEVRRRVGL
jgi:hypothetical protein